MGELRLSVARGRPVEPSELCLEEGKILVRIARSALEAAVAGLKPVLPDSLPEKLLRPGAAFVTIESRSHEGWELRGCIGFTRPVKSLAKAVADAAVEAALNDPRFPPLSREEASRVRLEVTVLGRMEPLPANPFEMIAGVRVGVHGLYVERPPYAGLLLPQVAVKEGWDSILFLTWACIKAGLDGTCWHDPSVKVYRFEARIWAEEEPNGRISEVALARVG